jgi:hypothetical protein
MPKLILALTLLVLPASAALAFLHPPVHHHRRLPHRLFRPSHPRPVHKPPHPVPLKH